MIRGSVLILKCPIIHGNTLYLEFQGLDLDLTASECGQDNGSLHCDSFTQQHCTVYSKKFIEI